MQTVHIREQEERRDRQRKKTNRNHKMHGSMIYKRNAWPNATSKKIDFRKSISVPLVLPCGPLRAIISLPSSRRHVIFGFGKPRALHTNFAELPSGTCKQLYLCVSECAHKVSQYLQGLHVATGELIQFCVVTYITTTTRIKYKKRKKI